MSEFYFNGTRWLSSTLYVVPLGFSNTASQPLTADAPDGFRAAFGLNDGSDLWLVDHTCEFFVAGGGNALSGTDKWVGTVHKQGSGGGDATVATVTIASGSSTVYREIVTAIDALLCNGTTYRIIGTSWDKTGSPGNLYVFETISYRIVAT